MILHFEEYALQNSNYSKVLSYYNKLPQFLHKMSADDILKEMNRNGTKAFYSQKAALPNRKTPVGDRSFLSSRFLFTAAAGR